MKIKSIILILAGVVMTVGAADSTRILLEKSKKRLHASLWKRMIENNTGVMLDYADKQGRVSIPTPDECVAGKPNAISWWTPIENGAFFNGLYIDALCNLYALNKSKQTAAEIHKLVAGLVLLQDVGKRPGFIARGVATDRKSHYPIGSDDQTFPWFYGLWRYLGTDLADAKERADLIRRMDTVARVVKALGWRMPCEEPYTIRGVWSQCHFASAVRLVFVNMIMLELTGDKFWKDSLEESLNHRFKNGKTRLELIGEGDVHMTYGETWIHASSVAALKEMLPMEKDPQRQKLYQQGLNVSSRAAAAYIGRFRGYNNDTTAMYRGDWRVMNTAWRRQPTAQDAVNLAMVELRLWNKNSPKIGYDKEHMMFPLFAAWDVLLCRDRTVIQPILPEIIAAFLHYDWDRVNYSAFFVGENIYSELVTGDYDLDTVRPAAAETQANKGNIVDNSDKRRVEITGDWPSSSSSSIRHGNNYLHDNNKDKGKKYVAYKPELPADGNYDVYMFWNKGSSRASEVPVDIYTTEGVKTVTIDQKTKGNAWELLGTFQLAANNARIVIRTDGTEGFVIADAVKLVKK